MTDMVSKIYNPLNLFRKLKNNNSSKYTFIIAISLIVITAFVLHFISTNENYYSKPIAKIISISEEASLSETTEGKKEQVKNQQIKAVIMNGNHKGEEVQLQNTTSFSQVYDLNFTVNDEVFITIKEGSNKEIADVKITDLKRDKYIVYIVFLFILLISLIGGLKGLKSLASVAINFIIFSAVIALFLQGYSLILISVIASILFIILSIVIVGGMNKKTLSAIIGTMAGTLISITIAVVVIQLNHWNGIHFEEMEFLTHPPEKIFIIEILIGTLGGIMDIAISISSSIKEIFDKDNKIERKVLISSGKEIGQDIMGTMANTLVFAYLSGSIPMILLLLRNGYPISYITNINLSLEFVRALTGSIGIVLSVPITIYTSVIIFKNNKIGGF